MQRGTDTYAELALVQQGTTNVGPFGMPPRLSAVYGTFSFCGAPALGGCTTYYQVTGTMVFPFVVLRWNNTTFDGIVTADTLAVRVSSNGQPPGATSFFLRTAGP